MFYQFRLSFFVLLTVVFCVAAVVLMDISDTLFYRPWVSIFLFLFAVILPLVPGVIYALTCSKTFGVSR